MDVTHQYLAALCVNILTFSCGNFVVWPSSSFLVLQSSESPFKTGPLSDVAAGWIIAIFALGGGFGAITSTWCAEKIGLKRTLQISALPMFIAWILLSFATNPVYLLVSRILGGITTGIAYNLIPIYTSDLADDSVRGFIGTFLQFSFNIGIETCFIMSYFIDYEVITWINIPLPLIYLLLFSFLPEPPIALILKNKTEKAAKSLRYYRNIKGLSSELPECYKLELESLKNQQSNKSEESQAVTWKDFTEPTALKAFLVGLCVLSMNVLCGCFTLINYTTIIFKQAGTNISPKISAIVVGALCILGSYAATIFVERGGRKLLLTISAFGSAFGTSILGAYMYFISKGYHMDSFGWVPLASFSFMVFISSLGLMTLPFLVISEILPLKIRNLAMMAAMGLLWILSFVILFVTPLITAHFGLHGTMLMFCMFSLLGGLFFIVYLPETKGRSIDEILGLL